jgi:hypothetical protein
MWKLALVQGPSVTVYDGSGATRKQHPDFATAVTSMLKEGWEPFAADSGNAVMVWMRLRAG